MQGVSATTIGFGEAVLAVIFGCGLLFWGTVYARFRRTTMLLLGVGAFVVMAVDVLAINHLGGSSVALLLALGAWQWWPCSCCRGPRRPRSVCSPT